MAQETASVPSSNLTYAIPLHLLNIPNLAVSMPEVYPYIISRQLDRDFLRVATESFVADRVVVTFYGIDQIVDAEISIVEVYDDRGVIFIGNTRRLHFFINYHSLGRHQNDQTDWLRKQIFDSLNMVYQTDESDRNQKSDPLTEDVQAIELQNLFRRLMGREPTVEDEILHPYSGENIITDHWNESFAHIRRLIQYRALVASKYELLEKTT